MNDNHVVIGRWTKKKEKAEFMSCNFYHFHWILIDIYSYNVLAYVCMYVCNCSFTQEPLNVENAKWKLKGVQLSGSRRMWVECFVVSSGAVWGPNRLCKPILLAWVQWWHNSLWCLQLFSKLLCKIIFQSRHVIHEYYIEPGKPGTNQRPSETSPSFKVGLFCNILFFFHNEAYRSQACL